MLTLKPLFLHPPLNFGWTLLDNLDLFLHLEPHWVAEQRYGWQAIDVIAAGGVTYNHPKWGTIIRHKSVRSTEWLHAAAIEKEISGFLAAAPLQSVLDK